MRRAVFGGAGPAGRLLPGGAPAAGHAVTAVARAPGTLPAHEQLNAGAGQLADARPAVTWP